MLCEHPWHKKGVNDVFGDPIDIPCGKCPACIVNKQQELVDRMLCEYNLHNQFSFVTLTYDDSHLHISQRSKKPTLCREDLHKYLDVIKHYKALPKFSYFAAGEYGDKFSRPHYHVIFFGLDYIQHKKFLDSHWKHGSIKVLPVTSSAFRYVSKYISSPSAKETFLDYGVEPPFHLMSKSFGASMYEKHIDEIAKHGFFLLGNRRIEVPRYYYNKLVPFNDLVVLQRETELAEKQRKLSFEANSSHLSVPVYLAQKRRITSSQLRAKSINSKSQTF